MTVQGDLFESSAPVLSTEDPFPPNPLDGLVHALKAVTTEKGTRFVTVRCGATMPKFRSRDRLAGAFGWESVVTCPTCQLPSRVEKPQTEETHHAHV